MEFGVLGEEEEVTNEHGHEGLSLMLILPMCVCHLCEGAFPSLHLAVRDHSCGSTDLGKHADTRNTV